MTQTNILIGLFICHWLADYTLPTFEMLRAKGSGKPLFPIFKHALTHTTLMFIFLLFANLSNEKLLVLSVFQLTTHFLIDTLKGNMNIWFPILQNPINRWHWVMFGFDQLLHALVIVLMSVYALP